MGSVFGSIRIKTHKKHQVFVFLCLLFILHPFQSAEALEKTITNQIGMEFILVPAGSFMMGSPETDQFRDKSETLHAVVIPKPFYLQSTEVTVKQWRSVMGRKLFGRKKGQDNMPVTRVSFYDCRKFIKKLNRLSGKTYRLPLETEWEYACRAGTATAYFWGNDIDCSKAMYSNNTKKNRDCTLFYSSLKLKLNQAAPVKNFAPNAWGFYDMHGNVWEWCSDEYRPYENAFSGSGYDTTKKETRIRRGGSWFGTGRSLRSANRAYSHPGAKFRTTGFRLVLETD